MVGIGIGTLIGICRYAHVHTYVYLCALFTEKHTELYAFLEMTCTLGIVSVVSNYCNLYQHDHLYFCFEKGYWKTRNNGRMEYRNNGITGNENALNFADMAHAIGIQRGSHCREL